MQPVIDPNIFVYLTIFAFAFLAVSFLIGGHHHHGHHASNPVGHGHSGGSNTHAAGGGHHHQGSHGNAQHHAQAQSGHANGARVERAANISPFSLQTILLFTAGVGVGGYFADILLLRSLLVVGVALAAGFSMGGLGYTFLNFLFKRQGSSDTVAIKDAVGQIGTVMVGIPAGGRGRISCRIGERNETFSAKSIGPGIPLNSVVRITGTAGSTVIVKPADPQELNNQIPSWRQLS